EVASIMVKDEKKGAELMDNSTLREVGLGGNNKLVENEIEILRSYDLMEANVRANSLTTTILFNEKFRNTPLFGSEIPFTLKILNPEEIERTQIFNLTINRQGIKIGTVEDSNRLSVLFGRDFKLNSLRFQLLPNENYNPKYSKHEIGTFLLKIVPLHETVTDLLDQLTVSAVSKVATVINLDITDPNKEKGTQILRSQIEIYNEWGLKDKNRVTDNTIRFLDARLNEVTLTLKNIENVVQTFKSKNKITELSSNSQQYLAIAQEVDNQKAQSQTQLKIIEALETILSTDQAQAQLVPSTLGIQESSLGSLVEKHNSLILQKERVKLSSGPLNPLLIDIDDQIREVRKSLLSNVQSLKRAFAISLNEASKKDNRLNELIKKVPSFEKDLVNITRNQTVQSELYAFILQKREEAAITGASNIEDSRIVTRSRFSEVVSPNKTIAWSSGLVIAFLIPIFFLSILNFFDNKVTDVHQIKQLTDVPLLGSISHVKKNNEAPVITANARSEVAEQFRNIRTALTYTQKGKKVKTILVSSFQPNDGKSFVSLNLAMSYALLDKKTIVLEFDLRKPKISAYLGINSSEGISSVLSGKLNAKAAIKQMSDYQDNLYLLPAGYIPPNPAELILSPHMKEMLEDLKKDFEYIIIDTPPFSLVTDSNLIQEYCDLCLVILRQSSTHVAVFEHLNWKLEHFAGTPTYLLLNDVGRKRAYRDNYLKYGYEKGYYSNV
ncbi:MAG TPA: polysaccharide biosynthesis tyrosine autokinase, partial [Puia sp.]|nr:polysaccharide biosynthesis tyrosine autokinase [Puia sp.]